MDLELTPIATVLSPLTDPEEAPKQGDEGAPDAWLVFEPGVLGALDGLRVGDEVIVLTWLHRARRDVLQVHPRSDPTRARQGVYSTRSPDRPNPIGLHRVTVTAVAGRPVATVADLQDVLNDTPVEQCKLDLIGGAPSPVVSLDRD